MSFLDGDLQLVVWQVRRARRTEVGRTQEPTALSTALPLISLARAARVVDVFDMAFNYGDFRLIDDSFTPDCRLHDPGLEMRGTAELRIGLTMLRRAFPDFQFSVEDQMVDGDKVILRYRGRGTHRAEFKGISATGRRVNYTGMMIARLEGNRIAEFWAQPDLLTVMQQLGARLVVAEPEPERLSA